MTARPCKLAHFRCDGFTLIELLVVLVILGLVVLGGSSALSASLPALRLKSATRIMADDLRATRRLALLQRREAAFRLVPGAYVPHEGELPHALPSGTQSRLTTIIGEARTNPDRIRFFADGSSTGGRIELQLGERRSGVEVDWLTGRVRVDE
jgi:general secretion pathway protein H